MVSVIGDSTFVHSGITGLVEMVYNPPESGHVVVILDNGTTAMTGFQESMVTGEALVRVVKGLGVREDHLHVINPHRKHHEENVALVKREVEHRGLSVIIARRECIQTARS